MKIKESTKLKVQALIHDLMTFRIMDGTAGEISIKYNTSCEHLHELKRRGMVIYDRQNRTIEWVAGYVDINHLTSILIKAYELRHKDQNKKETITMKALPSPSWWQRITKRIKSWSN